jgi:SAM-dependent methyltransferase
VPAWRDSEPAEVDAIRAYDASARSWASGASRVFDRLAEAVVARWPGPLTGLVVCDLGAGTGAASRAMRAAGAHPVALDAAPAMLREYGGVAVAGHALALPLRSRAVAGVVATFSLTHVVDCPAAFREVARVVEPGGPVVAAAHAGGPEHPCKAVVEEVLGTFGWSPPRWYGVLRRARGAEGELLRSAAVVAGLVGVVRADIEVDTGVSDPAQMLAWRLAMAHTAPFVAALAPERRAALVRRAVAALADAPPVVLVVTVVTGRVPGG